MALEPGTRLGPYEVLAPIGAGHDDRYKATDTRNAQIVALKMLPADLSAHPETQAQLERETRTISSLKHPSICTVVDVVRHDPATSFIVTEFVEGESLAQQLARGPLQLQEAIAVAIAIADSLDKAHKCGVVHGGLNPSVVMMTSAGPKLLDFGVGKASQGVEPSSASMLTTRTSASSLASVPSFAAPYLAPEQFAGSRVDARSDIYSLGAILYEMVTGKPAFQEKTDALLIAAVQTVDPEPASKVQPMIPSALDYVIARCLSKEPKQRFQTAFDVMSELQWSVKGTSQVEIALPAKGAEKKIQRAVWIALAAASALAVALASLTLARFERDAEPEEARFVASSLPAGTTPITVSPDGRWVAASFNAGAFIGLSLDSVTSQVLVGGTPTQPFWSPDGRSVAYFEDSKLKRADIGGGPSQIICDTPLPISVGTWNREGVILFPGGGVIQRVLAAGGQPTPITTLDQSKQETEHVAPVFLPDGRRFLFLATSSNPAESAIYVGSLDSSERTRLFAAESRTVFAEPGYLLFNHGDTVFAQKFDADTLMFTGEPIRVASGVPPLPPGPNTSPSHARWAAFSVSQNGVLAYRTGVTGAAPSSITEEQRSLVWFSRSGQATPIGTTGGYVGLDMSPDGKRVALHRHEGTGGDSWLFDFAQNRLQRLTFDASQENASPIWSPDGTRVAFASQRGNRWGLYVKSADGSGAEELITESETPKATMSWSPDGKLLVYVQLTGSGDLWTVPVSGDKKPFPLLQSPATEAFAQVSPDGKWMAFQSNETGRPEIYVRPFPEGPGKWQVSTDGGTFPRWRRDGSELFFYFNNNVFAADVRITGSSLEPGVPRSLFGLGAPNSALNHPVPYHRFAVTADGQRFLVSQAGLGAPVVGGGLADAIVGQVDQSGSAGAGATGPNAITVVVNWTRILEEK